MSVLCGLAIGPSGNGMIIGMVAGSIGAVAGTFGGAKTRNLLARMFGRDLRAALLKMQSPSALRRSLSFGRCAAHHEYYHPDGS
jgi:uncharacterized membrane protein